MSDIPTDTPEAAPEASQEPQSFDAEYVAKLRAEAAKYRTEAKANAAAAKRLAEIEESQKTEVQRTAERIAELEREAAAAKADALKFRIGTAAGLPAEAIGRLQGATEEELRADAETLAGLLGKPTPQPATAPAPAPVSGTVPPQEQTPQDLNQWFRDSLSRTK